jgi:murein DD-endopeptidase MepM/ murein hydrolase activator NlpD
MKRIICGFCVLLVTTVALFAEGDVPTKPRFTDMEVNHVRVATPGLFAQTTTLSIRLDSIPAEACCFPLEGAHVISPYGGNRNHTGADIKTRANDTIRCAFDGVVRMSKPYGAYGNVIVVRHATGLESVYSHNSKNLVRSGDTVKAGQPIALTGRTGRATTEHLHLEFRVNGCHFNPNLVFDLQTHELQHKVLRCTKTGDRVTVKLTEPEAPAKKPVSTKTKK